jgi:hypothetical protein
MYNTSIWTTILFLIIGCYGSIKEKLLSTKILTISLKIHLVGNNVSVWKLCYILLYRWRNMRTWHFYTCISDSSNVISFFETTWCHRLKVGCDVIIGAIDWSIVLYCDLIKVVLNLMNLYNEIFWMIKAWRLITYILKKYFLAD